LKVEKMHRLTLVALTMLAMMLAGCKYAQPSAPYGPGNPGHDADAGTLRLAAAD